MFFHSFIAMEYAFALFFFSFFTVNSSVNVAWSSCRRKFHTKGIKLKNFPQGYVISLCGVVDRHRVEPKVTSASPTQLFSSFLFFSRFFVLLLSIIIYLNNCYLINAINRVSREKVVHRISNIWINNLNFYHFSTIYCGKTRVDNHSS